MAISILDLGPNSASLTISSAPASAVRDAMVDWYTQHGWSLYDSYGDAWGSPFFVFRNLCAGGAAYKYVRFEITSIIRIEVYESWNSTTHTGTNKGQYSGSHDHALSLTSSRIYLFASSKHIGIMTLVTTTYSDPAFIFEVKRENPSDQNEATGYPAYFVTSASRLVIHGGTAYPHSFPRTIGGVGAAASALSSIRSRLLFDTGNAYSGTSKYYPTRTDTSSDIAETPSIFPYWAPTDASFPTQFMGRVFAVKIIPRDFGSMLDTVNIKCNAEGLSDPNGTDVQHFILASGQARIAVPV